MTTETMPDYLEKNFLEYVYRIFDIAYEDRISDIAHEDRIVNIEP